MVTSESSWVIGDGGGGVCMPSKGSVGLCSEAPLSRFAPDPEINHGLKAVSSWPETSRMMN